MTDEETVNLSLAMAKSGDMLDLSDISNIIVDKHSSRRSRRQNNSNSNANSCIYSE